MKNLILVRHAKSDWDLNLNDKMRPLQERGIIDATLVSSQFTKFLPDSFVIHSSTAKRAKATALIFATTIDYSVSNIKFREELYTFDENRLEKIIKSLNNDLKTVILFGHNEAITNFTNKFGSVYTNNVPTAGLVWLEFETEDWQNINIGNTVKVLFPKNIKQNRAQK